MKAHITESWLSRLRYKPGGAAQQLHWDDAEEGFGVRVSPAGTVAWIAQVKGKRVTLGKYPEMTLTQAREKAQQLRGGIHPWVAAFANPTLQHAYLDYVVKRDESGALSVSTAEDYAKTLLRYLGPHLDMKLRDITQDHIRAWYSELCAISVAKANYVMRILRAIFEYWCAIRPEWQMSNPVAILTAVGAWKKLPAKKRVVPRDKLGAWFDAIDRAPPFLRTICIVAMMLGLRVENASGLRVEWLRVDERVLRIPAPDMKGRAPFDLPLGPAVLELLLAAHPGGESGYFFAREDGEHYTEFYGAIRTICERAGVKFTPHDLRRTFATVAHSLGYTDITVGRLLSHSLTAAPRDMRVTGGYIVDSCETLRAPVEAVERAVLQMAGRTSLTMCPVHIAAAPSTPRAAPAAASGYDVEDGAMVI